MTTGALQVPNSGSGNVATNPITEDAITKHIQRTVLNKNDGTEITFNLNGAAVTSGSAPVTLPTDMAAARVSQDTSTLLNGNTALTPKFASIAASSSGDNSVVAAVTSKKIRVLALKITANAAVNAKWRSATTDKTGLSYFAAAGDGEVLPFNPLGWFETVAGDALQVNLSAAVAVGGHLTYVEV